VKKHTWTVEASESREWMYSMACAGCGATGYPLDDGGRYGRYFLIDPQLTNDHTPHKLSLVLDCDESARIIRRYTIECLRDFEEKHRDTTIRHFGSLIRDAITWTPEKTNIRVAYDLLHKIVIMASTSTERPLLREDDEYKSVLRVLRSAGFETVHRGLAKAILALGAAREDRGPEGDA